MFGLKTFVKVGVGIAELMNEFDDDPSANELHYSWVCPFDNLRCENSVKGLRFGVCKDLMFVCPRFVDKVDVFRCRDGLPCNKFTEGFGFGACRNEAFGGKLRVCCSRFIKGL